MSSREVHIAEKAEKLAESRKELSTQLVFRCTVRVSECDKCGTMTVGKDGSAFDTIITNAALAEDVFGLDGML